MYNVKITNYLHDMEVVIYEKPITTRERESKTCVIERGDFSYEIDREDLYLSEDRKKNLFASTAEENILHSLFVSHNRTKQKIYNYARSNKWEWFFTFTFNQTLVDSFDYDEVVVFMSDWLNYMYHHNKKSALKYLIVPEQHKSGAWHFHGIFSGLDYDLWKLTFSGKYVKNEPIYNVLSFGYGFTTATMVTNTKAVSHYICKYITKDIFDTIKNRKRYWVTKNCDCGKTETFLFTNEELEMLFASFGDADFQKSVSTPYNDMRYFQYNL